MAFYGSIDSADLIRLRRWLRRQAPAAIREKAFLALDSLRMLQHTLDARERDERWRAVGQRQLDDARREKIELALAQRDAALWALTELQKRRRGR